MFSEPVIITSCISGKTYDAVAEYDADATDPVERSILKDEPSPLVKVIWFILDEAVTIPRSGSDDVTAYELDNA
jgi:hypothetical protein